MKHVVLLILQCWALLALSDGTQFMNIDSLPTVGTVTYKGSSLRVFEVDGAQVAEPRVSFGDTCDSLRYSHLYQKYQLTFPIRIDVKTLETPTDSTKKVGLVIFTGLNLVADDALASKDANVTILARLTKPEEAQVIFLCDTFHRCQQLMEYVSSNPEDLRSAISFTLIGRVGSIYVKFDVLRSTNPPRINCELGRWVVFQRRVDGSLSFAQNWDTYVKGFGNPESNYWMGLDQLFAMTATSSKNPLYPLTSRCQLRIDAEDWRGIKYWGEYKMFQVLGPDQNYRLSIKQEVAGSQLVDLVRFHNEMPFSTFDRDNDGHVSESCSQLFGFGGWWFSACHAGNLNGAYTTDKTIDNHPSYSSIISSYKYVPLKSTLMRFKCY